MACHRRSQERDRISLPALQRIWESFKRLDNFSSARSHFFAYSSCHRKALVVLTWRVSLHFLNEVLVPCVSMLGDLCIFRLWCIVHVEWPQVIIEHSQTSRVFSRRAVTALPNDDSNPPQNHSGLHRLLIVGEAASLKDHLEYLAIYRSLQVSLK